MKSTGKQKVVTSGRLTGGRVQLNRAAPHPGPGSCPEPAYSLYSTDSEDQVTTLHQGLDRCAVLLNGILQAEASPAQPSRPRPGTGGTARPRPSTTVGKKTMKKPQRKSVHKNPQSGLGSTTPRPATRSPAAHSGVKLHPPRRPLYTPCQDHHLVSPAGSQSAIPPSGSQSAIPPSRSQTAIPPSRSQTAIPPSRSQTAIPPSRSQTAIPPSRSQSAIPPSGSQSAIPPSPSQTSVLLSVVQSSSPSVQLPLQHADFLSGAEAPPPPRAEEESVPVRDVDAQSSASHTCAHVDSQTRTICRPETVQYLLGELKTLIAGQGSVAEKLLSRLEQTMLSQLVNDGTDPDLSWDLQLHRQMMTQQLQESERLQKNMETLSHSEATALQQQLDVAQSKLQELQLDLAGLREVLQDTQNQLRGSMAETRTVRTELEAVRIRLAESEREKSELASLAQKRLEEIENLSRILQASETHSAVEGPVSDLDLQQCRQTQSPPERITQYLESLDQLGPKHTEFMAAERETSTRQPQTQTTGSQKPADTPVCPQNLHLDLVQVCEPQPKKGGGRLLDSTLSQCDVVSNWSDWSMRSGSTFDTRDEAAFRDGLAALDASIASLQRTMQLDLRR
ncbi:TSC22 domain family protein 1 [Echeneis naucrates]|uniref:TSC22 domain family protein 1 n=1 Tax=Echeneis naucrates TaxID=173247 RepID=UPI00111443DD|nr:coiled-coil domain-containing protein 14 [Echeneis naucrates]